MVEIVDLLDGLLDASIGGVPFLWADSRDEPGRRVLKFLFPGNDIPAFVDLGQDDGPIAMTGMVIGDDYVSQANALRDLFSSPGPYTLLHPLLGSFLVYSEKRPVFTDSQASLRCTKFEMSLWRDTPRQPVPPSTVPYHGMQSP